MDMTSEARRISTNVNYYNTAASRLDNQHTGAIVVVAQRLHLDDLIGTLALNRKVDRPHSSRDC